MLTSTARSFFNTRLMVFKHLVTNGHSVINGIDIRYIVPPGYVSVIRLPAASLNPPHKLLVLKLYNADYRMAPKWIDQRYAHLVVNCGCNGWTGDNKCNSSSNLASFWTVGRRLLRLGNVGPNAIVFTAGMLDKTPPTWTFPIIVEPVWSASVPHGPKMAIILNFCKTF